MMAARNDSLQNLLNVMQAGVRARAAAFPNAMPMVERLFSALQTPGSVGKPESTARPPVCTHLTAAYAQGQSGPTPIPELTAAFAAIESHLRWSRRPGSEAEGEAFHNGHANATIIGPSGTGNDGLEVRHDLRIGVSLLAPNIQYPRHRHPPEELYIVLAPGQWMGENPLTGNDNPLAPRSSGDLVHNRPNVWHSMASKSTPLLALWCLWTAG
ncbi:MAG: hypothetical protein ACJAU6_003512 [Alphaproteobacteria bacterium]|jgi:hypothetical protein